MSLKSTQFRDSHQHTHQNVCFFLPVISFIVVFIALFYVCSYLGLYDHEYVSPIMSRLVCFYIFRFYIMAYQMVKIDSRGDKDG